MDVLGWLWWVAASLLGLVWRLAWFLLGGWVATLAQIGIIVLVIFGYKYGWRQAPQEVASRLGTFGRFAWAWLRSKESPPPAVRPLTAERAAGTGRHHAFRRKRQFGDVQINVSTLLSLLMIAGLGLMATLK